MKDYLPIQKALIAIKSKNIALRKSSKEFFFFFYATVLLPITYNAVGS